MKRNKAKRSELVLEVFRPEIVDLMIDSRARLQVSETKDVYTSRDIKGLGKSYMFERSRVNGIEAYSFYIQYYGLTGLYKAINKLIDSGKQNLINDLLTDENLGCDRWKHERKVLLQELPGKNRSRIPKPSF